VHLEARRVAPGLHTALLQALHGAPERGSVEIVHDFLEGTTCRDLVSELGRSPPVDSNELFDIATSFASSEEAVGAIFDGKKGKRADDAPAEGSGSKDP
jgi:hypothetical protein